MLRRLATALCLLTTTGVISPCAANWVHCSAKGTSDTGAFAVETTVVRVQNTSPAGLKSLQAQLLAYVAKTDPSAHGNTASCVASEDEALASQHYSRALNAASRQLGWDHVTALDPDSWLSAKQQQESSFQP